MIKLPRLVAKKNVLLPLAGNLQRAPRKYYSVLFFLFSASGSPPQHPTLHPLRLCLRLTLLLRNKSSFLGRSQQSRRRLSHGWLLRENADLSSSLLLHRSFFSLSFLALFLPSALLYSHSPVQPPSLPDCNNSNNDNNGDGPGDGDVKKHNIEITNTLSNQWPSFDLCVYVQYVCVHVCFLSGF